MLQFLLSSKDFARATCFIREAHPYRNRTANSEKPLPVSQTVGFSSNYSVNINSPVLFWNEVSHDIELEDS